MQYQLRCGNSPDEDTGELKHCETMEEAMELFLSGGWWKLSWERPNGHRVRLIRTSKNTIEVTDLSELILTQLRGLRI